MFGQRKYGRRPLLSDGRVQHADGLLGPRAGACRQKTVPGVLSHVPDKRHEPAVRCVQTAANAPQAQRRLAARLYCFVSN